MQAVTPTVYEKRKEEKKKRNAVQKPTKNKQANKPFQKYEGERLLLKKSEKKKSTENSSKSEVQPLKKKNRSLNARKRKPI